SPHDGVYLTSAELAYTRSLHAANDRLDFTAPAGQVLAISGFSSPDISLYDVTNPALPVAVGTGISNSGGTYTVQAQVPGSGLGPHALLAVGGAGRDSPTQILPVSATDLHTGGADYLVLAYDSLLPAAQQLAALHNAEGLQTAVVPVHAV